MEDYKTQLISEPSFYSQHYNDMMASLQNLDLVYGVCENQGSSLRDNHGVFDVSHYSPYSPHTQFVDWGSTNHPSEFLDHMNCLNEGPQYLHAPTLNDELMSTNPCSGYSWMYNVTNPELSMPINIAHTDGPSYMGSCTMNQEGYYNRGFTTLRANGENGFCNQVLTERSNGVNGYFKQGFSQRSNEISAESLESITKLQDIVSMAMMKEGSLFLQRALLQHNQEIKTAILDRVLDHIYQLLMDQYGHYMIDKLVECCDVHELTQIVEKVASEPDSLVTAACTKEGSSSIQKLIKRIKKSPLGLVLTLALVPRVVDIATNKTARHIFRECLSLLNSQANKVLYEEAIKKFDELARDEIGCLAINDCIDFAANYLDREKIMQLVIDNAVFLAYDPYGNYIVQNAVKIPGYGSQICEKLKGHYVNLSVKKSGSHVVERCMESCSLAVTLAISEILEKRKAIELARNDYGNYVLQAALRATKRFDLRLKRSLVRAIRPGLASIKLSKNGQKLASMIQTMAS